MAWLVIILKVQGNSPPPEESGEEVFEPLGTADEVRSKISERFKSTDWSDTSRGYFLDEDETYSIEFGVGNEIPLLSASMNIRGGDESIPAITQFAKMNGWQLYDSSASWMDLDNPSNEGWSGYDQLRKGYLASKVDDEET